MSTLAQRNERALGGSSNYPAGAENDPNAPYNQHDDCETCSECEGEKKVTCAECEGAGKNPETPCRHCEDGTQDCDECNGTGEVPVVSAAESRADYEEAKADAEREERE